MPRCLKCGRHINSLMEFQKELTAISAILDSNGIDLDYKPYHDLEPEPLDATYWACPECLEILFTDRTLAIMFLRGRIRLRKHPNRKVHYQIEPNRHLGACLDKVSLVTRDWSQVTCKKCLKARKYTEP